MRAALMYGAGDVRVEDPPDPETVRPTDASITLTGGAGPARACIEQLLPDVLDGTIAPGRVLDREFPLDRTPDSCRAMADRQVLKALVRP